MSLYPTISVDLIAHRGACSNARAEFVKLFGDEDVPVIFGNFLKLRETEYLDIDWAGEYLLSDSGEKEWIKLRREIKVRFISQNPLNGSFRTQEEFADRQRIRVARAQLFWIELVTTFMLLVYKHGLIPATDTTRLAPPDDWVDDWADDVDIFQEDDDYRYE